MIVALRLTSRASFRLLRKPVTTIADPSLPVVAMLSACVALVAAPDDASPELS
ncbi:hypothetical protein [Novosphingobium sp. 9]|uniref:hypothetical protein n=1 Tax=Novosphingobium sp. 9 TaxID=2025349 RepID=UPI0021B56415|nr:hypothetical protein [Novosphingobium sp. 9]